MSKCETRHILTRAVWVCPWYAAEKPHESVKTSREKKNAVGGQQSVQYDKAGVAWQTESVSVTFTIGSDVEELEKVRE